MTSRIGRSTTVLVIGAVLAACGSSHPSASSGSASAPGPTGSPAESSTPTPTPTPTPRASAPGTDDNPVAVVTATCSGPSLDEGTAKSGADGIQEFRDGTFSCSVRSDDPRVAGDEAAIPWAEDKWYTPPFGAMVQWGSSVRTNDGGAWDGSGAGTFSTDRGDIIPMWYRGTGDYAGLRLFELWSGSGPTWQIEGVITPGAPPTTQDLPPVKAPGSSPSTELPSASVSASLDPAQTFGPMTEVTGTWNPVTVEPAVATTGVNGTQLRDGRIVRTHQLNDPRVSGTETASWNADRYDTSDHRSVDVQWGVIRIDNAGGAWIGSYTGVRTGPDGDIIAAWLRGAGDYAGLGYFELLRGDGTLDGQLFPLTSPDALPF